jgi:hypothetical protein
MGDVVMASQFRIVRGDAHNVERQVEELLECGWRTSGSPQLSVAWDERGAILNDYVIQAMVRGGDK